MRGSLVLTFLLLASPAYAQDGARFYLSTDRVFAPGQQAASNAALATSVAQAVSWSPDAEEYLQLLASFAKIERQIAPFAGPLRTSSELLSYLPAGAFVYGAVPNLGGKIGEGLLAAEQQAFENAAFRTWWSSETGLELRRLVDRRAVAVVRHRLPRVVRELVIVPRVDERPARARGLYVGIREERLVEVAVVGEGGGERRRAGGQLAGRAGR